MNLVLIRHGETEENRSGIILGQKHGNLTQEAKQDIKRLRKELERIKIDIVYTSDLKRCVETAKILFEHRDIKTILESRLREINFGIYQGQKYSSIQDNYLNDLNKKFPNGESNNDFIKRVISFINDLIDDNNNRTAALVCHSGTISIIKSSAKQISYSVEIQNKAKHNKIYELTIKDKLNYPT